MRRILIGTASAIALIAGSALAAETTSPFSSGSASSAQSPGVPASRGAGSDMNCPPGSTDPACRIVSSPGVGPSGTGTMGSGDFTLDPRYGIGGSTTGGFSGSSGLGSSTPGGRSDSSTGGSSGGGTSGGATSGSGSR